jgi:hypothetical protein
MMEMSKFNVGHDLASLNTRNCRKETITCHNSADNQQIELSYTLWFI